MPKKKLQAAIARNGGAVANVVTKHEKLSEEELRVAAFNARDNQNASITDKMANDNRRNTLLSEMGFDWFDIEDIKPNPNNAYKITEEDVKNLAGLIYKPKTVFKSSTEKGAGAPASFWQKSMAMHGVWFPAAAINLGPSVMSRQSSLCTQATWGKGTSRHPREPRVSKCLPTNSSNGERTIQA